MAELALSLNSLAIAATLQPWQVIAMIILLQTRQGTANGPVYRWYDKISLSPWRRSSWSTVWWNWVLWR